MRAGLFFLIIIPCILLSCTTDSGSYLPGYSGAPGEIIVVSDPDQWDLSTRDTVRNSLGKNRHGLPQPQAMFKLIHVSSSAFSDIFRLHRNILIIDIDPKITKGKVEVKKNAWSKGQMVIRFSVPDETGFFRAWSKNEQQVAAYYNLIETERLISRNKRFGPTEINQQILERHGIAISLQKDVYIATEKDNFIWIRLERERTAGGFAHQVSQGLLIYHYPYSDTNTFTLDYLLHVRDSVTKAYIPGPSDGSYMTTSYQVILPEAQEIDFKNNYAIEIRGLWRMEGDFMGGPFYSLTTIDEKNNRIITVEGYVFAPQFGKREYLREIEAMARSLEMPK